MSRSLFGVGVVFGAFISLLASTDGARAQEQPKYLYSIKYTCGVQERGLSETGVYTTEINIQRLDFVGSATIAIDARSSESIFDPSLGAGSGVLPFEFKGSQSRVISCRELLDLVGFTDGDPDARSGLVRIASPEPLGIVAVYTAKSCNTRATFSWLFDRRRGGPPAVCDGDIDHEVVQYEPLAVEGADPGGGGPF